MLKKNKRKFEGRLHLKKGDEVLVLSGKDKGRHGKISVVLPDAGAVIVENINVVTRHQKPTGQAGRQAAMRAQSGEIQKPAPLAAGKVMLICPKCSKPTKPGATHTTQGQKTRVCRNCHELIDA